MMVNMQPLPVPFDQIVGQPMQFSPQNPPHCPQSVVAIGQLAPQAVPIVAAALANYISQRAARDPVCTFVYNQQSQNNWCNNNWEQSVTVVYYYMAIALEKGFYTDFQVALQEGVQRYVQMLSAMAIATYPQLRQLVSPQMVEQASKVLPEIEQMMQQIDQRLRSGAVGAMPGGYPQQQYPQQGFPQQGYPQQQMGSFSMGMPQGMMPGAMPATNPWIAGQMPYQTMAYQNQLMQQANQQRSVFQSGMPQPQSMAAFTTAGSSQVLTNQFKTATVNLAAEKYKDIPAKPFQPVEIAPAKTELQQYTGRGSSRYVDPQPVQQAPQETQVLNMVGPQLFQLGPNEDPVKKIENNKSWLLAACKWKVDPKADMKDYWRPTAIQPMIPHVNVFTHVLVAVETGLSGHGLSKILYVVCNPNEVGLDRQDMDRIRHQLQPRWKETYEPSTNNTQGQETTTVTKAEPPAPPPEKLEGILDDLNLIELNMSSIEEAMTMTRYTHEQLKGGVSRSSRADVTLKHVFVSAKDHMPFLTRLEKFTTFKEVADAMKKYVAEDAEGNTLFIKKLDRYLTKHLNDVLMYNMSLPKVSVDSFMDDAGNLLGPIEQAFGSYFSNILKEREKEFIQRILKPVEYTDIQVNVVNSDDDTEIENDKGTKVFGLNQNVVVTYLDIMSKDLLIGEAINQPRVVYRDNLPQLYDVIDEIANKLKDRPIVKSIILTKDDAIYEVVEGYAGGHNNKPYILIQTA